jgi:hypothetical protein
VNNVAPEAVEVLPKFDLSIHGEDALDISAAQLKAILATVARTTFPPEVLYKIVAPTAGSDKQLLAYNLCDGATPQAEIGKKARLDKGNLSRSITKWIEAGIVVRVGSEGLPPSRVPIDQAERQSRFGGKVDHGGRDI